MVLLGWTNIGLDRTKLCILPSIDRKDWTRAAPCHVRFTPFWLANFETCGASQVLLIFALACIVSHLISDCQLSQ